MDPLAFSNQIREQMESYFVKGTEEMLRNAQSLQNLSKGVEMGLQGKQMANESMRKVLEQLNMPTREDVTELLQYLQKIESRIVGLEEKIEDIADALAGAEKALKPQPAAHPAPPAATAPPASSPAAAPADKPAAAAKAPAAKPAAPAKKPAAQAKKPDAPAKKSAFDPKKARERSRK